MSLFCGCVMASAEKKNNTNIKKQQTQSSELVIFAFLQSSRESRHGW